MVRKPEHSTPTAETPARRVLGEVHPPGSAAAPPSRDDLVTTWPNLYFREVLAALLTVIVLVVISMLFNAPLEDPADPTRTPNPAKAPWYFVGLQELLTYFDPWIAGVMIPALIVLGLCAIPYLDPNRSGGGVYTVRQRPLASSIFIAGTVGWFVLMVIGLGFRGPGWVWTWPWSPAATPEAAAAARSLPNWIGVPLVLAYFVVGARWIARRTAAWPSFGAARRWTFALLSLAFAGTLLKILLKLLFGIQYLVHFERFGFNL
jgi:hypothetical protein